jgi:hypothetical protein
MCAVLGVKLFVLTNSAGGSQPGMKEGGIMIIRDHIRWAAVNPLSDVCEDSRFGERSSKTASSYSDRMADLARQAAKEMNASEWVHEGTYCWTSSVSLLLFHSRLARSLFLSVSYLVFLPSQPFIFSFSLSFSLLSFPSLCSQRPYLRDSL